MTTQLTVTGKFEPNPFRPDIPDEIDSVNSTLYTYLRELAENLRAAHDLNQAGDTTFSWELLTRLDSSKRYDLGSTGRFYHPDYGVIHARYVKFSHMNSGGWIGGPVGLDMSSQPSNWSVTNDYSYSASDVVIGVMGSYVLPINDSWGWVICNGPNIQSVPVRKLTGLELFDSLSWPVSDALGVDSDGREIAKVISVGSESEIDSAPIDGGYKLVDAPVNGPNSVMRFMPLFWTTNFPTTMIASLTTVGTTLQADADFFMTNDLAGVIWESKDNWDHPLAGFETKVDYSHTVLEFTINLSGDTPSLSDTNGPVLTINGKLGDGTPHVWYVRLINYRVTGTDTSAFIRLNFDSLAGGFSMTDPVYPNLIDNMFIGFVSSGYNTTPSPLPSKLSARMLLSNINCTGANSVLLVGGGSPKMNLRIANGYDDTYNVCPERIVRNMQLLGYSGWINHYLGMSHYMQWAWDSGESRFIMTDVSQPINNPCKIWHIDFFTRLQKAGFNVIVSVSYEIINYLSIHSWRQMDHAGNPALTGWDPPSSLLSPCIVPAMDWLTRVVTQICQIQQSCGLTVRFEVGEPWWWVRFDTLVPCFYDSATVAKYLSDTGRVAPTIALMSDPMDSDDLAYLNWLGSRLADSTFRLRDAAKAVDSNGLVYILTYLPQILQNPGQPATPEVKRVNLPIEWAYPAFDVLQIEDYDFVIENRLDLSREARALIESRLSYPRSAQHYFSGFALYKSAPQVWNYSTLAIKQAYEFGVPEVFIWAYTQVVRDGYVFTLDSSQLFRRWEVMAGNLFIDLLGYSEGRIKSWINDSVGAITTRVSELESDVTLLQGLSGVGGLTSRVTNLESGQITLQQSINLESTQRQQSANAISLRLSSLELAVTVLSGTDLSGTLLGITTNLTSLNNSVALINNKLSTVISAESNLEVRVTAAETLITAVDGRVSTVRDSLVNYQPVLTEPVAQIPALLSPWINYGSGYGGARYYKNAEGLITIEGLVQAPTGTSVTDVLLFTLLPGFVPPDDLTFNCYGAGGTFRVNINSLGEVHLILCNAVFSSLSGISFYAA